MPAFSLRRALALPFVLASLTCAAPAAAQQHDIDPARAEALAARLDEFRARLALTEEQKAAVEPILRESFERRAALAEKMRGGSKPSRREMRRMRDDAERIRNETRAALAPILSPAQLAEYDRIQEEVREEARQKFRGRRRAG